MMPALPGAHLVFVHPRLPLASLKAGFNAGPRFDHPRQFRQQRLSQLRLGHTRRGEIIAVAIAWVLIHGIPRGAGLQRPVVCEGTTGDHQPFLRPCPFAFETRLDTSGDHLNLYWAFLSVAYRQVCPPSGTERLSPATHRLPWGLGATAAPVIRGQWRLQVADHGGAGHAQHIALATCSQRVAKLRMATEFIITCHPAVWNLITPHLKHLQALLVACLIAHVFGHVAGLASWRIPCPVLRQGQAKIEQGMVVATDVAHKDADLAIVNLAPVTTPLALNAHR